MVEQSVVTDEVRARIGETSQPVSVTLTPLMASRAAEVASGRAGQTFNEGDIAPGSVITALTSVVRHLVLPNLLPASLIVSNEWEFTRPLRVGETFEVVDRIDSINERFGGRLGYSVHVRTAVECRDSSGEIVARSVNALAWYDPAGMREPAS
jgi:hypothetical protein